MASAAASGSAAASASASAVLLTFQQGWPGRKHQRNGSGSAVGIALASAAALTEATAMTAAIMTAVTFILIAWLAELGLILDSDVVVSDCLSCKKVDVRSRSNVCRS